MIQCRWKVLVLLLFSFGCGKSLDKQVEEQIRTAAAADLKKEEVEIVSVKEGPGNAAVAEIVVRTAVRLEKQEDGWKIEEVRLGRNRWESWDRILQAIEESRINDTNSQLDEITEAVDSYTATHGQVPQVASFESLIDLINPEYLRTVIRIDAWWNGFEYSPRGDRTFVLRSAGPDREFGTPDDLVRGQR